MIGGRTCRGLTKASMELSSSSEQVAEEIIPRLGFGNHMFSRFLTDASGKIEAAEARDEKIAGVWLTETGMECD